ncbi:MAG: leucine-rich repeat protein [Ruminococcus sp.]
MKNAVKKIISVLLSASTMLFCIPAVHSQAAQEMWLYGEENGFSYKIQLNYGYAVITGYTEITGYNIDKGVVEIPSEILGNPVTTIGTRAFCGCGHTDEYYHANDTLSEETHGCSGCGIKEIIIPDSVTTIEAEAFYDCESLTKIHFPSGLKDFYGTGEAITDDYVGYASWIKGCDSLRELTISDDNPYYKSINGVIYSKDEKTIGPVPPAIPFDSVDFDGITAIGDFAFCCRESENEFVIPKQITSIGAYAFFGCCYEDYWTNFDEEKSVNIQLNEGLTSIGDYAFSNIMYLREMELPDSLLTLGKSAFSETSLESMTIPSKITAIPDSLFKGCSNLETVILPEGITKIGEWAFYGTQMTSIQLPSTLKTIDAHAFEAFGGTTINIPDSVEYIGEYAFANNGYMTSCKLPNSITKIEPYTFYDCELKSITIPEGVTEIGEGAFSGNNLDSVKLPETLRKIDNEAFYHGLTGKKSVLIPDNVTEIGAYAFADCYLGDIKLPEKLTSYGLGAFSSTTLSAIQFPEGTKSLTTVTVAGTPLGVEEPTINRIYLPSSLKELSPLAIAKDGSYGPVSTGSDPYDVDSYWFYDLVMVEDIYFAGTEQEWNALTKDWDFEKYNTDPSVMDSVSVHFNAAVGSDVKGDVNADGVFSAADIVMMQKWLLGMGRLVNPEAGDLCKDNRLNVFDLCQMKSMIPSFMVAIADAVWNAETRTITADVTYENLPSGSDAWIGVVPSDTPHNENDADAASIQCKWLSGFESGSFDGFLLSDNSLSGNYDLRIYSSDNGGHEIACVTFYIDGPKGEITNVQWNADTRTVTADVTYDNFPAVSNAWIGVVPSDTPHNELDADRADVAYIALKKFESGSFPGIKVPAGISGSYDLRIYSNDNGGRELASVTFIIS